MTFRVALLDDYQGVARSLADWASLPDSHVVAFGDHVADEDALVARLHPFDAVVGMRERTPFQKSLLQRLPNLRLLITTGMGNASYDIAAANAAGVTVCGVPSTQTLPTADLAWGLVLALARSIVREDAAIRGGGWQRTVGMDLNGRTLGVIGLGNLGAKVAEYGRVFGMRVIAWSTNLTAARAAAAGAALVTKQELLRTADVVSIHLVLGPRSRGLLQEADLRLMKPTAYLVNTSRGPIVNEQALVRALHEGWIAGAGLDVHEAEPLPPDHPLRSEPRAVLTPHLGYVTTDNYRLWYEGALTVVRAFRAGTPINILKPPQG